MPTLLDIMEELDKPGRDPRQTIQVFAFDPTVKTIEDLKEGQVLPGIVTNITNFGCFVDVGIKENGLVHISELADRFVSDPTSGLHPSACQGEGSKRRPIQKTCSIIHERDLNDERED